MMPTMTRRTFLTSAAALTLVVIAGPDGLRVVRAGETKEITAFAPNAWITIDESGLITVMVNKAEMGQGVTTALPMLVADELDADWQQVRFEPAPASQEYKDPVWGVQSTGGSTSVRHMHAALRLAGAAAREMLIAAASITWQVPASECLTEKGAVLHPAKGLKLPYGSLVRQALNLPVPKEPKVRDWRSGPLIGQSLPRLDIVEKVQGIARFGIDTIVPKMIYATVARPPAFGAKMKTMNRDAALATPGVTHIEEVPGGIAVCGRTLDAAWRGRKALAITWSDGDRPDLDNKILSGLLLGALEKKGLTAAAKGDAGAALQTAAKTIDVIYQLPYLAHATMEPMNCTARITPERCDVWAATQNQSGVRRLAAELSGLQPEKVFVTTTFLGGGFGRRFELDVVAEALTLARKTGRPVKVVWTREEDMRHGFYRPANSCHIRVGLDGDGRISAWRHTVACPSIFARIFPEQVKDGIDPQAVEGVADIIYDIPHLFVDYVRLDTPVPVGFWRSVGSSHNAFTVESCMNEAAHAAGKDPLAFRLAHLGHEPRAREVLEKVAAMAQWSQTAPGRGKGLALHRCFGSYVAQIAEVAVTAAGEVLVQQVWCAIDCGRTVNPAIIKAQMHSGILFGLSAALKEEISLKNGGVATENFHDYPILRLGEAPRIEVAIIDSIENPGGVGEPGVPPIAPAVAGAVFFATGKWLRQLPLTAARISSAQGLAA